MLLQKLKTILRGKGYVLNTRPFELNIVGLRSASTVPNRFDDEIHVFFKVSTLNWHYHVFKATTDPGTFWLNQPMQPEGTAILAQGQYVNAYKLGIHLKKYLALVQRKPVTVIRDYNRDSILNFKNGKHDTGQFGINIHRANATGTTKTVNKNSAGCQVFENAKDFDFFISLCKRHEQLYGNSFTYTLIDFRAVQQQNVRYVAAGVSLVGIGAIAYIFKDNIASLFKNLFKNFTSSKRTDSQTKGQVTPALDTQTPSQTNS